MSYNTSKSKSYHTHCFSENENLYCIICKKPLTDSYVVDHWGNKAHTYHNIEHCYSCGRFCNVESTKNTYKHKDGRIICSRCFSDRIENEGQILKNAYYVRSLLSKVGFKNIPNKIQIKLVDRQKMSSISMINTAQGLTQISRINYYNGKQDFSARIFILDFLPTIQFQAILAHEMLHVWTAIHELNLGNYEEALCNIGSTLVYNSNRKNKLSVFLNDQMKINPDPMYGIRYMELKSRLKKLGWEHFIAEVKSKNNYR